MSEDGILSRVKTARPRSGISGDERAGVWVENRCESGIGTEVQLDVTRDVEVEGPMTTADTWLSAIPRILPDQPRVQVL